MALIPGVNAAEKRMIENMPKKLVRELFQRRATSRNTDSCRFPIFTTDDPDVRGDIMTNRH